MRIFESALEEPYGNAKKRTFFSEVWWEDIGKLYVVAADISTNCVIYMRAKLYVVATDISTNCVIYMRAKLFVVATDISTNCVIYMRAKLTL
jgi:tRNA uridine 5-carbamoylmethylation protein Kti12